MRAAIDWADKENARAGSPLNGKIATDKVAVMGQSCGGFLSISLGADPRVDTIGVFNSGVQAAAPGAPPSPFPNADALPAVHGPVLLINGHDRDFMTAASKSTFDALKHVPAFYGARHGAGHTATVFHPGGGEFANVASNWVCVAVQGRQEGRSDVRRQGLQPLHESELGRGCERAQVDGAMRAWSSAPLGGPFHLDQNRPGGWAVLDEPTTGSGPT